MTAKQAQSKRQTIAAKVAAAALARQAEETAFEAAKEQAWLSLWARALRLKLLIKDKPAVADEYDWWFSHFKVNLADETLGTGNSHSPMVGGANLTLRDYDTLSADLATGQGYYDAFIAYEQAARRRREEVAERKNAALAKLNANDIEVLGLPAKFNP